MHLTKSEFILAVMSSLVLTWSSRAVARPVGAKGLVVCLCSRKVAKSPDFE